MAQRRTAEAGGGTSSSIEPPGRFPDEPPPSAVPEFPDPLGWVGWQLLERRFVLLSGTLDDKAATEAGTALMTLDAMGDDPVHLQVDSGDGTIGAALALMDIIDLCGVAVRAMGLGNVAGPAVGVLAVCSHRTLSPHTRLRLFEPTVEVAGHARQLHQLAQAHLDRWAAFCSRVAEASGRPEDQLRHDAASGRSFSAPEAVAYGLADEVATPEARILPLPGRRIGFGAR